MIFTEPILTEDEYKKLVEETLGEYRPHIQHKVVLCKDDEKIKAFFSYYPYTPKTMFLHYCWFNKGVTINKVKCWLGFFEYAKNDFQYIMGVVDARNKQALIWALKTGFEITGMRLDVSKNLIIDVIREL